MTIFDRLLQTNDGTNRDDKFVNDPIHGHMRLFSIDLEFIDTPHFQRLRNLKQLGPAYLVFPGASHNRFEHSLGVAHLAHSMAEKFRTRQPELDISLEQVACVRLAGLLHDLGHGPFSHVFDNEFMKCARPDLQWSHEDASKLLFQDMIDVYHIDMDREHVRFIQSLIDGRQDSHSIPYGFLYDIVANKRNSVDVDKFDYLARDCHNAGIKSSYDPHRIMSQARVIDNQVCYSSSDAFNVYELFHTRYSLFKRVYTHRVTKALEFMLTDALLAADPVLGISNKVDRPSEYVYLTDDIVQEIERSHNPDLEKAQQILKRIRLRVLYCYIDEHILSAQESYNLGPVCEAKLKTMKEIMSYCNGTVKESDLIVEYLKINYAMKDKNPVDHLRFYSAKFNENECFSIPKEHVSCLIPNLFEETVLRIYSRNSSPTTVQALQKAFRDYLASKQCLRTPETLLPSAALEDVNVTPDSKRVCAMVNPVFHARNTLPEGYQGSPIKRRHLSLLDL